MKKNVFLEVLKISGATVIGWLFWVIIFSFIIPTDGEALPEWASVLSLFLGIATVLLLVMANRFNSMQKAYQNTRSAYSSIKIYAEKENSLLDKANRVADKYMNYEGTVQTNVAKERSQGQVKLKNVKIRSFEQFQSQLEMYPNLQANTGIMELLSQIKECENTLAYQKVAYNSSVEEYNTLIHSFPEVILKTLFQFKEAEYYMPDAAEDIISDEELGI